MCFSAGCALHKTLKEGAAVGGMGMQGRAVVCSVGSTCKKMGNFLGYLLVVGGSSLQSETACEV